MSITNRILLQLSIEGHIVRTRPLGSWLSSQYRWTTTERWFTGHGREIAAAAARAELVRRWLRTYGPGTTNDIAWWAKWTKRQVLDALAELGAVEVTVEPAPGAPPAPAWVLADDLDDDAVAVTSDGPVVALLPSLDPAIDGLEGARVDPRRPRPAAVRQQRQRRTDRPRRRRRGRGVGAGRRRPRRHRVARVRSAPRHAAASPPRPTTLTDVVRRRARHPAVSDTAADASRRRHRLSGALVRSRTDEWSDIVAAALTLEQKSP